MTQTDRPVNISHVERRDRLKQLRANLAAFGSDAIILTPGSNMRYYFGLGWGETERLVCAIVTAKYTIFICPKFEDTALYAALPEPSEYAFWEEHENPYRLAASILTDNGVTRVVLDPNCTFGHATGLSEAYGQGIGSAAPIIAPLRARKSSSELALLNAAKQITLNVHRKIFEWIKPGHHVSEVRQEIDRLHRVAGADNGSYFCAVQFGEATSHPHGVPGDPTLKRDELILIDTGCTLDGYHSDITRTYALDKQSVQVEDLWQLEKRAQQTAFETARPGLPCECVDLAARKILESSGLGPDYALPGLPHRTGHGIGLDIHEGPYLVRGDKTLMAPGMCFSNEPMIVVPDCLGIRLEDHFYLTADGPIWFTDPQTDLYQPFDR